MVATLLYMTYVAEFSRCLCRNRISRSSSSGWPLRGDACGGTLSSGVFGAQDVYALVLAWPKTRWVLVHAYHCLHVAQWASLPLEHSFPFTFVEQYLTASSVFKVTMLPIWTILTILTFLTIQRTPPSLIGRHAHLPNTEASLDGTDGSPGLHAAALGLLIIDSKTQSLIG